MVTKAPFGAWVDIGCGFDALLEIIYIEDLTPEKYQKDDWMEVGTKIVAKVFHFRDDSKQIYLKQKDIS